MSSGRIPIKVTCRSKSAVRIIAASVALILGNTASSLAQDGGPAHIVFAQHYAYLASTPALIADAYATVDPDPLGRYAVINRSEPILGSDGLPVSPSEQTGRASLLLYDSHADRTKLLWSDTAQKPCEVSGVSWLGGADAAVITINEHQDPAADARAEYPASQLYLLRPNSAGSSIRMIIGQNTHLRVDPSPKISIAIVAERGVAPSSEGRYPLLAFRYFTVDARGVVGLPLDIDPRCRHVNVWSKDGEVTYFRTLVSGASVSPRIYETYSFNVRTNSLLRVDHIPEGDANAAEKPVDSEVRLDTGELASKPPIGGDGKFPAVQNVNMTPLWCARADDKHEGKLPDCMMLALDVDDSYLLADESAILYVTDLSVYSIRLTRQNRPVADAAFRALQDRLASERSRKAAAAAERASRKDTDWER